MTSRCNSTCYCYFDPRNHDYFDDEKDSEQCVSATTSPSPSPSPSPTPVNNTNIIFCQNPSRCCEHNSDGKKCSDFGFHIIFCCHYNDQIDPICDNWQDCCTHGGTCGHGDMAHIPSCCEYDDCEYMPGAQMETVNQ